MNETSDGELLRAYAEHGAEEGFAALVRRHTNLVFSAARRQTQDVRTAADVTQTVFIILARKAASFRREMTLASWLLKATYYTAANARRQAQRRQLTEREAMQYFQQSGENLDWAQVAPALDKALLNLSERDRAAVALRYFEQKSYKEIGLTIGLPEDSVRKRVDRAMERLRATLGKRGVRGTTGALAEHGVKAAPMELVGKAAGSALATATQANALLPVLTRETMRSLDLLRCITAAMGMAVAILFAVLAIVGSRIIMSGTFLHHSVNKTVGATSEEVASIRSNSNRRIRVTGFAPAHKSDSGMIFGTVVDADTGQPISSFEISALGPAARFRYDGKKDLTFPGTSGSFSFRPTSEEPFYLVDARADGYWPEELTYQTALGSKNILEFKLKQSDGVFGRIIEVNGQPAVGAVAILSCLTPE